MMSVVVLQSKPLFESPPKVFENIFDDPAVESPFSQLLRRKTYSIYLSINPRRIAECLPFLPLGEILTMAHDFLSETDSSVFCCHRIVSLPIAMEDHLPIDKMRRRRWKVEEIFSRTISDSRN